AQADQAGILKEPAGRFQLLSKAPLPLDLGVVVVVDEDERRVQQWLVERRIAQFVRVLEIGEEAIDGSWISQQGPERVPFLERRSEWIARREREHQQNGGQPAHVHTRLIGDPRRRLTDS